jgi:hypothetical protein
MLRSYLAASTCLLAFTLFNLVKGDSAVDYYKGQVQVTNPQINQNEEYVEIDEFKNLAITAIHDSIMSVCETASCSGSWDSGYYGFIGTIDAIFTPDSKQEVMDQIRNILDKSFQAESKLSQGILTAPGQFILVRYDSGNQQGDITVDITKADAGQEACAVLQKIGTAGSVIPEIGPFLGLINLGC